MKFYLTAGFAFLATTTSVVAETCGAKDVIASLGIVSKDASYMDDATEIADDSIQSDSPVVRDEEALVKHFQEDLHCEIIVEDPKEQQIVCDAYGKFAANQKESVDVCFDESFLETNKEQPEAGKVHWYTERFEKALTGYTERIKAGVPECADQITEHYGPVEEDMAAILVIYPAAE